MKLKSLVFIFPVLFLFLACDEYSTKLCQEQNRFGPTNLEGQYFMKMRNDDLTVEETLVSIKKIAPATYQINDDANSVMQVCKVGDYVFSERLLENGRYSILLLEAHDNSLEFVATDFDKDILGKLGIPYQIEEETEKSFLLSPISKLVGVFKNRTDEKAKHLIIDNSNVSAQTLLQALFPMPMAMKLFKK